MSTITLKKVTDKNTKKQIMDEHEKALRLIESLKSDLKKNLNTKVTPTPQVAPKVTKVVKEDNLKKDENVSIESLVENFNNFSNNLKQEMNEEVEVIEQLKEDIESEKELIVNIYASDVTVSLSSLIENYNTLIEEQKNNLTVEKEKNTDALELHRESFSEEKREYSEKLLKKQDTFNLDSSRMDKQDIYETKQSVNMQSKEREALEVNNKMLIDDLKYEYKIANKESYVLLENEQKEQSEAIEKSEVLKEKFEQSVNIKVTSVVSKEKASNAQEFKTLSQEFENKINLKTTQLENFEEENNSLERQIEELQRELNTVQEKAHTLASKTIDSKSSTQSFEAMKDVAMEQARGKK